MNFQGLSATPKLASNFAGVIFSMKLTTKKSTAYLRSVGALATPYCGAYRRVKLLEHAMKIVKRVLKNRIRGLVTIDDMQFGFIPGKSTTHALFILRRMQSKFRERKQKLHMCSVDLEKAFDRVPRKMTEWALRKDWQKCRCKQ